MLNILKFLQFYLIWLYFPVLVTGLPHSASWQDLKVSIQFGGAQYWAKLLSYAAPDSWQLDSLVL